MNPVQHSVAISLTKGMTTCRANTKAYGCSIKRQCQSVVSSSTIKVQPCANANSWPKPEYMASKLLFGYMPYAYTLVVKQHQQNSLLPLILTQKDKCVEICPYESACIALSLLVFGSGTHKLILLHPPTFIATQLQLLGNYFSTR